MPSKPEKTPSPVAPKLNRKVWVGGRNARNSMRHKDSSGPSWYSLLHDAGVSLTDDIREAEIVLVVDIQESDFRKVKYRAPHSAMRVLIRQEPPQVLPMNYRRRVVSRFEVVLDCGMNPEVSKLPLLRPQFWPVTRHPGPANRDSRHAVMVNSNQLALLPGEFYSLRRRCLYELELVDVFGRDWNIRHPRKMLKLGYHIVQSLRFGSVPRIESARHWFRHSHLKIDAPVDKIQTMSGYRVALVIENSPDFLTEKIFDSFFAGCFPVYVGPPVTNFGIPAELCIQSRPELEHIERSILEALEVDYEKWRRTLQAWLNDDRVQKKWSAESVVDAVIRQLIG